MQAKPTPAWSLLYSTMVLCDILVHVEEKIMNFKLNKGSKIRKVGNKGTALKSCETREVPYIPADHLVLLYSL